MVNLASRTAKFVEKSGLADEYPDDGGLFQQAADEGDSIAEAYEQCDYNRAMRRIMAITDRANQFVEHAQPWTLRKDPDKARQLQDVCTIGLNLFRQIAVYLAPVLPRLAQQTGELLDKPIEHWDESRTPLVGTPVAKFKHMMTRVEKKQVNAMIEASTQSEDNGAALGATGVSPAEHGQDAQFNDSPQPLADTPLVETCSFDDFIKVDLRVARIVEANDVPKANKLLQLTLSLGGERRLNVFAGIKAGYRPEELVGRLVLCVANLAPRKMKFGTSEGMILAAVGDDAKEIFLLAPDEGARAGQRVQ